jgi:xanthine dehydrogenase YagR molybdenum-binding subunit
MVKSLNTEAARKSPGVRAIMSSADPEGKLVVPYPWWVPAGPPVLLFDQHCRYQGDEVAAVAAETSYQAHDAIHLIRVEYVELPHLLRAQDALKPGKALVHTTGNLVRHAEKYERGDLAKGFSEADALVEEIYETSCEIHATVETHVAVARWEGEQVTVWVPTQAIYEERKALAAILGLPISSVRVISQYVGGSFGCKAELSKHTLIAALLARKTRRPVKLALTREESFLCAGNRPPNVMRLMAGAKKDGSLTALEFTNLGAVGAYADWADAAGWAAGSYACPNVLTQDTEVYINAGKARAFRGPGAVQSAWALEQMIDALADKIGMDPVEFRVKNIPTVHPRTGESYTSIGLRECLLKGAEAFGWKKARAARASTDDPIKSGVGVAACRWITEGGPPTTVIVTLFPDGSAGLNMAAADQGTGTKTIMAMVVAEELGIPLEKIHIEYADTGTTQYGKSGGGSHSVMVYAPAVRAAAADVKRQVLQVAAGELKQSATELSFKDGKIVPLNDSRKVRSLSELKDLAQREQITGIGHPASEPKGKLVAAYAAQFAEVEVNVHTGEIRVIRLLACHDSGRVMNPLTHESQIFGGMVMGIGFALTERRVLDEHQTGRMVNANWHDYKIPTAKDVPLDQLCLTIDPHDLECNSVGAKGAGEIGAVPPAPAIANAVYHATGIRVSRSPISPMQMLASLAARREAR